MRCRASAQYAHAPLPVTSNALLRLLVYFPISKCVILPFVLSQSCIDQCSGPYLAAFSLSVAHLTRTTSSPILKRGVVASCPFVEVVFIAALRLVDCLLSPPCAHQTSFEVVCSAPRPCARTQRRPPQSPRRALECTWHAAPGRPHHRIRSVVRSGRKPNASSNGVWPVHLKAD